MSYNMGNSCPGLNAAATMSGFNPYNTLKDGLIEATTKVTIDILNATYPRVGEPTRDRMRRNLRTRELVHLNTGSQFSTATTYSLQEEEGLSQRKLVYYTDDFPVRIDEVLDIVDDCTEVNCLLIRTAITVILEEGDNPEDISKVVGDLLDASLKDGSFFAAFPADAITC